MKRSMEVIVEAGPKGFRAVRPAGWGGCCPGGTSIGAWEFFVNQAARNLQEGRLDDELRRWFREKPEVFGMFIAWDIETKQCDMARDMGMPGFSEADRLRPVVIPSRWDIFKRWANDMRYWFAIGQGWSFVRCEWQGARRKIVRKAVSALKGAAEFVGAVATELWMMPQRIAEEREAHLQAQYEQDKATWLAEHRAFEAEGRAA